MVDGLRSWNDRAPKRAIVDFVTRATTPGGPEFVVPADRIATFDNDGTLWVEQPLPPQLDFVFRRWAEEINADPALSGSGAVSIHHREGPRVLREGGQPGSRGRRVAAKGLRPILVPHASYGQSALTWSSSAWVLVPAFSVRSRSPSGCSGSSRSPMSPTALFRSSSDSFTSSTWGW